MLCDNVVGWAGCFWWRRVEGRGGVCLHRLASRRPVGKAVLPLAESSHKVLLGNEGCMELTTRRMCFHSVIVDQARDFYREDDRLSAKNPSLGNSNLRQTFLLSPLSSSRSPPRRTLRMCKPARTRDLGLAQAKWFVGPLSNPSVTPLNISPASRWPF